MRVLYSRRCNSSFVQNSMYKQLISYQMGRQIFRFNYNDHQQQEVEERRRITIIKRNKMKKKEV